MHIPTGYPAGITYELLPFLPYEQRVPAALIHKNSSYYNQGMMPNGMKLAPQQTVSSLDYVCEWQSCRMRFLTAKELLGHTEEEHIGRLPVRVSGLRRRVQGNSLACQWRGCGESGKVFTVRYKLLLHVQQAHCRERAAQQKNMNITTVRCAPLIGVFVPQDSFKFAGRPSRCILHEESCISSVVDFSKCTVMSTACTVSLTMTIYV